MTGSLIQLAHGSDNPWIDTEIVAATELQPFCHAAGGGSAQPERLN
jgi:tartrate dehydratase alpha subunit/fumarate hydratase class I-like protein